MAIELSPIARRALGGSPMPSFRTQEGEDDFGSLTGSDVADAWGPGIVLESTGGGSRIPSSYYESLGKARLQTAETARRKFEAEQAAAAAAMERTRAGQQAQADYLRSQIGQGVPGAISAGLAQQETAGREYIQGEYNRLLESLGQRRTAGEQQLGMGYDALRNYLMQNPPVAYAQAEPAARTMAQNVLQQYMQQRGISQAPVQAEIDTLNAQLAGGALNYNQLLNVLAASERQQQQSRLAEEQMARQLGVSSLGQLYAGATSGLEQTRLAALNELASRIGQSRLAAEAQAAARDQALSDALAALLGQGLIGGGDQVPKLMETTPAVAPAAPTPVEQLAAKLAGVRSPALANRITNFVAANPNATPAQIRRQFPQLGANITR